MVEDTNEVPHADYGGDLSQGYPSIEDENGISANKWLNSSTKEHIELGKLIKKSKNQDPL